MMNNNRVSEYLKASLFELTYTVDEYSRKEVMDMLCGRIQKVINSTEIVFYLYNKWNVNEPISYFSSHYPVKCFKKTSPKEFMTEFNLKMDVNVIDSNSAIGKHYPNQSVFLLKIRSKDRFYGFLLLVFPEDLVISITTLEKVRFIIEQFLKILYTQRHHQYLQNRNAQLFQLSTSLHSVHQTTEVLEKVYETITSMYPTFEFYLLMSQEYESDSLPLRMIEYTGEAAYSPGTMAFINNELIVNYDGKLNQTNVYSPLSGRQGVYGVLQITIPQNIELATEEVDIIERFTDMVGRAIERTTLYQSSNQLVSDLQIINTASHDLNLNLDFKEITETVKKHIFESCYSEQVGIIFFSNVEDDGREAFEVLDGSTDYFYTDNGIKLVCHVYEKMKENPKPTLSGNFHAENIETPYNSMMIIPMIGADSLIGVIIVAHRTPYYFSFDKYKFIQSFVQHASLAYTNSILKDRLKQTAITDYLTKLYSRNHLDKMIGEHMENKFGSGAFILFDIDDFKQINDTYGHYVGDKVLIQVAQILKNAMKEDQVAARWGGEEFAIYLPNCSLEGAAKKANEIRKKVIKNTNPKVSLSCGVSTWDSTRKDTVEQLFIRTDEALYAAKTSGKNKVVQTS